MKKPLIIIFLLSLSFLSLAGSFKIGAFLFRNQAYSIEKEGDTFVISLNGKKIFFFEKLKAYYSNGEDRVLFVSETKEIIWIGDKRFEFDINLNPVLDFRRLRFFRLFLKNERFVFIGDVEPSIFDTETERIYRLSSLFYKNGRGLFLVQPEDVLFSKNCFVFFSNPYLIVYSLEKEKPVFVKKLDFNFVTYAGFINKIPCFQFDYRTFVFVDTKKMQVKTGKKAKENKIVFLGTIGKKENLKIRFFVSGNGLSPKIDAEFKVYRGKNLIFSRKIEDLKVDLMNLTGFRPFVFRQIEKAVAVNFLDKTIVLCVNENGLIDLRIIDGKSYFSIVNGRLKVF